MTERSIRELLGLDAAVAHNYSKAIPLECPDKTLLYGVELEIENARPDWSVNGFDVKGDGSLRNDGYEYISSPMTFSNLAYGLQQFFRKSGVDDHNYSERCSTHVHTNVQDLTWDQLATVCLLYQIFEKLLFAYIGNDRDKNIFCVPWSETTINYDLINTIKNNERSLRQWQKYTALNLRTIHTLGTIEWRHMEGCHDLDKILNWCRIIGCLYAFARKSTLEDAKKYIINLNSTSEYQGTLDTIFGEYARLLMVPGYRELLEDGVITMKYSLVVDPAKQRKQKELAEAQARILQQAHEAHLRESAEILSREHNERYNWGHCRWAYDYLMIHNGGLTPEQQEVYTMRHRRHLELTRRPVAQPRVVQRMNQEIPIPEPINVQEVTNTTDPNNGTITFTWGTR